MTKKLFFLTMTLNFMNLPDCGEMLRLVQNRYVEEMREANK